MRSATCWKPSAVLALVFALSGLSPLAGQFANADLAGTVHGPDGAALPAVHVEVTNEASGLVRSTETAANGSYALHGLKPGTYTVAFSLDGFRTLERTGAELRVGQETRLDAALELGEVEEAITVAGEAPLVESSSKEIGGTLTSVEFQELPTQNRSFALFAALLPGVQPAPSTESTSSDTLFVNGQDDNNNSFSVDGADNDDDVIGARAGAQVRTPIEAIQEFQVLTTQFDAEFGRSLGGVLNAVTKSGGNQFRGSAFGYFQKSAWNEKDFFARRDGLPKPDSKFDSLGFTLGGPILRNKLHFFASYEDDSDQAGIVRSFVSRPELNFTTTEDNKIENVLGKVDYQITQGQLLSARWLREQSPQFNQIIGSTTTLEASREEADIDSNWVATLDSVFGSRVFNSGRISFTKEDVAFANPGFNGNGQDFAAQRNQSPSLSRPTVLEGASTVAQARVNTSKQADDTVSVFVPDWHGQHEWRAGFQYARRHEDFTDFGFLNGQFGFDTDRPFDPNDIATYPTAFLLRVGGGLTAKIPDNTTVGAFVQDDWQVSPRLTLNLGLRWDHESVTHDSTDYAPRFGFVWDPTGKGRSVVRGGFGRFYDRFEMGSFSAFFLDAVTITSGFLDRLPTAGADPQLFFDIAQANGITTLEGLRDFLAAMLESGAGPVLNTNPTVDNPDRRQPYADTASLGFEHDLGHGVAVGVDLVHTENHDTLLAVDLNPFSSSEGGRPNLSVVGGQTVPLGSITTWVNAGESRYNAIQLSASKRFGHRLGGRVSYTYADSSGDYGDAGAGTATAYFQTRTATGYDFDSGTILGGPLDLGLGDPRNDGQPVNWARRHNFVVSGRYLVPKTSWRDNGGLLFAWVYRVMSGDRFTVLTNERLDNGNRAPAQAGDYGATIPSDIARDHVHFDGRLFGAEQPSFQRLDLSMRYRVPVGGGRSFAVLADVFNATNRANFESSGGTILGTAGFLTPNGTFDPGARQYQLGVRFDF